MLKTLKKFGRVLPISVETGGVLNSLFPVLNLVGFEIDKKDCVILYFITFAIFKIT